MVVKPLIKWVGGKTQILTTVLDAIPECTGTYYEPFLGGGSVLLGLLSLGKLKGRICASDLNPHLIHFYREIQMNPERFITDVSELLSSIIDLKEGYYTQRGYFNDTTRPLSAARFWFINKTCFRGMFRTGPNGYNVPFGHGKSPVLDPEHVRAVSKLIQRVEFKHCSYIDALKDITLNNFVYLDPPYVPITAVSFVDYTLEGFSSIDHETLFSLCKRLPCPFLMSNSNAPLLKESFEGYEIKTIDVRRAINSKNPGERTTEVLVSNSK
jgi:DNA adenine methylase